MEDLTMPDSSEPAAIIPLLIATGVPAPALPATIASTFPTLSACELSVAVQVAQAQAEQWVVRRQ
jgi:hypothetical protein